MPKPPAAHAIATTIHGRYCVRPPNGPPAGLLVGFHGYAQTAEMAAADLDSIPGAEAWLAVSVQALNRFYTKTGDIVANWMTSQDRDHAIADNVAYVAKVVAAVRAAAPDVVGAGATGGRPVFVGFSQGTAIAFRAAAASGDDCAGVIALGGDIPPEIRATSLRLPPVLLGRGSDDHWYSKAKLRTDVAWLTSTGTPMTVCEYAGGHEWTDAFREVSAHFLSSMGPVPMNGT